MIGPKKFKGTIKLFGIFKIKRNLDLTIELIEVCKTGNSNRELNPYLWNSEKINVLEPFLRKFCTISWMRA